MPADPGDPARVRAGPPDPDTELRRSSRDPEVLRTRLEAWLASTLPAGSAPGVLPLVESAANGMSSDTVLFDAQWSDGNGRLTRSLVARIAPDPSDIPVFPVYDLAGQFRTVSSVARLTEVPVPPPLWLEDDPSVVGMRFFVMERVEGRVPPDVLPYNFGDNWLFDASREERQSLQDATVAILAELHSAPDPVATFPHLLTAHTDAVAMTGASAHDELLRAHVKSRQLWYEYVASGGDRSPLIERTFRWLEEHWPRPPEQAVLSWGDSRIGNILYSGFTPAAVLDWEMAGIGPRELDVAWLVCAHRVFEDIASSYALEGMPGFLRIPDVAASYENLTGYAVRDLPFYLTYSALQWAIVFLRTGQRSVHFGERDAPLETDDFLMNRASLEEMVRDSYWKRFL